MKKKWIIVSYNSKYFLRVGRFVFQCQIGSGGFKQFSRKVEGDNSTPLGLWKISSIYFRPDRIIRPKTFKKNILKINKINRNSAWCNDIKSKHYNNHIEINQFSKRNISYERLWREDCAYDIFLEISHNRKPTIMNKGSAIFIHCSFNDYRCTSGCVALKKRDLTFLIKKMKHEVFIKI
jgi:L,D-peptidoglycan transpeptidase YkuD (ErfK/YbiS/YcfS/YnhG family)